MNIKLYTKMNYSQLLTNNYKQYVIDMRREFHMNPELSWQEFRTSKRIKEELDKIGIPYISCAGTGVVATIKGNMAGGTIALRADMDALQVNECEDHSYKSQNHGIMHACGHDGHIAMLLGAARVLNEMRHEIKGTVKLIFQPAEEIAEGAAKMIEEGVMEKVDGIFGIHLWSGLDFGKISVEAGPRMASVDIFKINIKGEGGHGCLPHQGIDAVVAASSIIMDLQAIVSREISPFESAVVSVGVLKAGTKFNVLASEALLEGSTRCFSHETRNRFPKIIERVVENTARTYRAKANIEYRSAVPPTINDSRCSEIARNTVVKLWDKGAIQNVEKLTVGGDFALYMDKAPGVLVFLGARNEQKQTVYPHHHEKFDIDEDSLAMGTLLYSQYAIDFLNCL